MAGEQTSKKPRSLSALAEVVAAPATAKPALDGDRVPPKPGDRAQHPRKDAPGMRRGTAAPFHRLFPLTAAQLKWECEKIPSGISRVGVKTFSAGVCPVTWCPQHPQFDPILLPQPSALLSYSLTSPSQTTIPLRGALALPPPRFVASFPVYCGLFFLQQAYLLIFQIGRSNTFCTCGDLHLQDPRGSPPSLMKQEGGLGDRKTHDSFKLLLLSPSRTRVHASTQKAFLLFVSHWKKKRCVVRGFF